METRAFAPLYTTATPNNTGGLLPATSITATNSSATANSVPFAGGAGCGAYQLQIGNKTSAWAHVNVGQVGAVVAATVAAGYAIAPGAVVVISVQPEVNAASVILDAAPGTATAVVFSRGEGL